MSERARTVALATVVWGVTVVLLGLFLGAEATAPCLALDPTPCIDAWLASHPASADIVNVARPWPWLGLFGLGTVVIVLVALVARHRERSSSGV